MSVLSHKQLIDLVLKKIRKFIADDSLTYKLAANFMLRLVWQFGSADDRIACLQNVQEQEATDFDLLLFRVWPRWNLSKDERAKVFSFCADQLITGVLMEPNRHPSVTNKWSDDTAQCFRQFYANLVPEEKQQIKNSVAAVLVNKPDDESNHLLNIIDINLYSELLNGMDLQTFNSGFDHYFQQLIQRYISLPLLLKQHDKSLSVDIIIFAHLDIEFNDLRNHIIKSTTQLAESTPEPFKILERITELVFLCLSNDHEALAVVYVIIMDAFMSRINENHKQKIIALLKQKSQCIPSASPVGSLLSRTIACYALLSTRQKLESTSLINAVKTRVISDLIQQYAGTLSSFLDKETGESIALSSKRV